MSGEESGSMKSTNIKWHHGFVTPEDREALLGHRGATLWLTGLSGSGKSTVSRALEKALVERGVQAYVLDGDNVRHGLNGDLGFTSEDRTENIRRVGHVAQLLVDAGVLCITAFISPYRADRDQVRALHGDGQFFEVHIDCDVAVCESRDPKGLYAKARRGEIANFTGISAPYEAPVDPEFRVRTDAWTLEECVEHLIGGLVERGLIRAK